MDEIYHRRQMAEDLAERLIHPSMLDRPLRSGLFLSGMRRTGKSTFLKEDLIPVLERHGAIVIYVDLWGNDTPDKAGMILDAIKAKLKELQGPVGTVVDVAKRVTKIGAKAHGFSIGCDH
jgi:predicted AAA+ superfamily ATPase